MIDLLGDEDYDDIYNYLRDNWTHFKRQVFRDFLQSVIWAGQNRCTAMKSWRGTTS